MEGWKVAVAIYAAVVATGALALEVRRWVESGARLVVNIMPEAETINIPGTKGKKYLLATVMNRGRSPTTITHFALLVFPTWWHRLLRRNRETMLVPNPAPLGSQKNLPYELLPGALWHGMAEHEKDLPLLIDSGRLYVAVYATHSDKPSLRRVIKRIRPEKEPAG